MSGDAPEAVFVDPRVASRMDQDGGEGLVGYIRQDVYENAVRSSRGRETIVQIMSGPDNRLIALSSWGRVFALVAEDQGSPPSWKIVADPLESQELDS